MGKSTRNWFSNFLPFDRPFVYDGNAYRTPEHFYQAMKSKDPVFRSSVAAAGTARDAKNMGRRAELREDWEAIKYDVMKMAQEFRFRGGTAMREKLMTTEGEIVEWNSWHDCEWGKCICDKCKGEGKSLLGKILMGIRDETK